MTPKKPKLEKIPMTRKVIAGGMLTTFATGIGWFYTNMFAPLEARVRVVEKDVAVEQVIIKEVQKDVGEIKSDVKELLKRTRRR